ncbi:molybdopterin molybdotransferase MoeA [Streptomyces sp. NPDC006798]|uniref:molybdopterin molybdotransferase MoeA n=1 Tax=Streptomyces sp. NPDC006798 TaxID=3155462 RepID=UPI0033F207CF
MSGGSRPGGRKATGGSLAAAAPTAPTAPTVPVDLTDLTDDGVEDALALVGRAYDPAASREVRADTGADAPGRDAERDDGCDDGFEDVLGLVGRSAPRGVPAASREPAARDVPGGDDGVEDALALVRRVAYGSGAERSADRAGPTGRAGATAPTGRTGPKGSAEAAGERRAGTAWPEARAAAARAGREVFRGDRTRRVPLELGLGLVLAEELTALCDLPSFDTSAMDGWAVAGPGPWDLDDSAPVLAGRDDVPPLPDGTAVPIATGARVPPDATAVIRTEHARTDPARGLLLPSRTVAHGQDIRPRGQECRSGERLLPAGATVTPAVLGLAAAAGYDELAVVIRPTVEVLVLGDELLDGGLPHDGRIRDALGPMTAPWLLALGAEVLGTRRIGDDAKALHRAVTGSAADLVITTGGTAAGPVDHVHPVLRKAGATLVVDGVGVRPGHPMLLARFPDGPGPRCLVGLPGNPLAAVSGLLTLAAPLLRALGGLPEPVPYTAPVRDEVSGHPRDTRLVPVVHSGALLVPLRYHGPAMLRGIASADGLAVVPPGGARPGDELEVLDLPSGRGGADVL